MDRSSFVVCTDRKATDRPRPGRESEVYYLSYRHHNDSLFVARDVSTKKLVLIPGSRDREFFASADHAESELAIALTNGDLFVPDLRGLDYSTRKDDDGDFLKTLCRHFVAIIGTYCPLDATGAACGEDTYYFYSAFVCELGDSTFILTAGHSIEAFVKNVTEKRISLGEQWLLDTFGVGATSKDLIPFNLLDHKIWHAFEQDAGMDAALILLSNNERRLLEANGINPLGPNNWIVPAGDAVAGYILLGIPEERSHTVSEGNAIRGRAKPFFMAIERLEDDTTHEFARFHGKLRDPIAPLTTIVGMSGGPIFACVEKDGELYYYAIAIQSVWDESSHQIHATFIEPFIRDLFIRAFGHYLSQSDD